MAAGGYFPRTPRLGLRGLRRAAAVALVLAAAAAHTQEPRAAPVAVVQPTQEIALLLVAHAAVAAPGEPTSGGTLIRALRPITGERTALPVVAHAKTPDGAEWLRVMLPGRPNGRQGWIEQRGTRSSTTGWHVVVRTAARLVGVYREGRLVRSFSAVVGKPTTPTPHGNFFVEENVLMPPGSAGGPFALALSARSDVLQEFEGGPGQIAIHGVLNLGGVPGTAVSHGCIRLDDHDIRWLDARITPGVPVTITS